MIYNTFVANVLRRWYLFSRKGLLYNKQVNLNSTRVPVESLRYSWGHLPLLLAYLQRASAHPLGFHWCSYFDGKVDFKGDVLDIMELCHDWPRFDFTPDSKMFLNVSEYKDEGGRVVHRETNMQALPARRSARRCPQHCGRDIYVLNNCV
ncbi:hypothetical protein JB92DRAFT_1917301 [Gautieria morchelliformis]|nr:hypothetical protein JB92DRAFT_1917301 [Gautieria morchelliformis]